jgi:hypothetical protein
MDVQLQEWVYENMWFSVNCAVLEQAYSNTVVKSSYLLQCDCHILQATVQKNVFMLLSSSGVNRLFLLVYKIKCESVWNYPSCSIATAMYCTEFIMSVSYVD